MPPAQPRYSAPRRCAHAGVRAASMTCRNLPAPPGEVLKPTLSSTCFFPGAPLRARRSAAALECSSPPPPALHAASSRGSRSSSSVASSSSPPPTGRRRTSTSTAPALGNPSAFRSASARQLLLPPATASALFHAPAAPLRLHNILDSDFHLTQAR